MRPPGTRAHSPLVTRTSAMDSTAAIHISNCAAANTPYRATNPTTHHAVRVAALRRNQASRVACKGEGVDMKRSSVSPMC